MPVNSRRFGVGRRLRGGANETLLSWGRAIRHGDRHLLEVDGTRVLLDCGLFQGRREETERPNGYLGSCPRAQGGPPFTCAHRLFRPLRRAGEHGLFRKRLCHSGHRISPRPILADSAHLQELDCQYVNRKERRRRDLPSAVIYRRRRTCDRAAIRRGPLWGVVTPVSGMKATFHDAGHSLGSAAISLRLTQAGLTRSYCFRVI